MSKLKVYRDCVYCGKVVKTTSSLIKNNKDIKISSGKLEVSSYFPYRSMLFVLDEQKKARDLLYESKAYPILNISDDSVCMQERVVITEVCHLKELLRYLEYPEFLTERDILEIKKVIFSGTFAKDNCELFGYKENKPEDFDYYKDGIRITDCEELKKCIRREKRNQKIGRRSFSGIYDHLLSEEYFDLIDSLGNNTLFDILQGFENNIDAFKPHKEEGPVKKIIPNKKMFL